MIHLLSRAVLAGAIAFCLCNAPLSMAAERYVSLSGSDSNSCTASEDPTTPKRTFASAVACINAGDTLWIRGGVWTERIDLQVGSKTGTPLAWITIKGYTGEVVTIRYDGTTENSYGPIKARGNIGYIVFQDLVLDGADEELGSNWEIRDGNHHFILRNIEFKNFLGTGLAVDGTNIVVEYCRIHDQRNPGANGSKAYGIYLSNNDNVIQFNEIANNPGGGIHFFPGGNNNIIRYNRIHHNNFQNSSVAGIHVFEDADYYSGTAQITNTQVYGNVVYKNNLNSLHSGPGGILIGNGGTGTKVWNNTVYGNKGWGINVQSGANGPPVNTVVQNNIVTGNTAGQIVDAGTGTTISYNACLSGDACGSTGKVTLATSTEPFVDAITDDYRLKQGTNAVRNAGVEIAVRPNYVSAPDIGAYEQPEVGTLDVVGSYIEMRVNVMTPGVLPTSGITGITVTCLGCTGTPVVDSANVKASSNLVVQLAISGITSSGTCRVTVGATNITDSLFIGGSTFPGQGLNSLAATTVTGTCTNSSGVSLPGNPWSHFALNEGSGTVASDDTGNNRHGTVSAGVTWVADASGTGVTIPTDVAYRQITSTFGSGVNPTTQSFAKCVYVKPSLSGNTQKVVFSSGTNGSSQRWYAGWGTVGGQVQWGIGIQGSGFLTGSEFPVTEKLTLVCIVNDSGADTATLWIDGVKGTIAGKSVKSFTSYVLTNNLIVGNDGTNTVNNGGFTVYEVWIWNTKPTDLNMTDLWASLAPPSTNPCMAQTHVQWEHVYTDQALAPIVITPKPDGSVDVIANGGVAFRIQYTCTGTAGVTISPTLYYSLNGTDFNLPVPQTLGANNVAMWGPVGGITYFNSDGTSGCLNSTGLTPHNGVTIIDTASTPSFALAQNHCRADRFIVQFGNVPDTAFYFRVKSFTGLDFANGYAQQVKVNVVQPQASVPW